MSEDGTDLMFERKWTARLKRRYGERFRIIAGLLSLLLGMLYALQITPAYKASYFLGVFLIAMACLQIAFGVALLVRPWETDSTGHQLSAAAATRIARQWFRAGMTGKFLLIMLLILHIAGAGPRFGTPAFDLLALTVESIVLICLIVARPARSLPALNR